MYLLKKIGAPLVALLIISVLLLAFVVVKYEQNGLFFPSFSSPKDDSTEAAETAETENSVNNNFKYIIVLSKEDSFNE